MEVQKEKWQLEFEANNIWRAKEILRSIIRWRYDTEIYLAYGKILYDVKDYYEAGKYLFIAGEKTDGQYSRAIEIFLDRHQYADFNQLMSNFPKRFIQENFDNYPRNVQKYMDMRGYKKKTFEKFNEDNRYVQKPSSLFSKIVGLVLFSFAMASLVIGGMTIFNWII